MSATPQQPAPQPNSTLLILSLAAFTFFAYLCTGVPLAVLPGHVHGDMGFSTTMAGIVTGVQYLVTLLSRPISGYLGDTLGAKKTVMLGLVLCALSGALLTLAAVTHSWPVASLSILLGSRVLLGIALGLIGTSAINWGISRLGSESTARMLSWNGIAAYGGIGIGAPLGVLMERSLGLWSLGILTIALGAAGVFMAYRKESPALTQGVRLPFRAVFMQVVPYGSSLALGTIGYGTLSAFITLYYTEHGWDGAAWCLTAYACAYIGTRLMLADVVQRVGGYRIAIVCLGIESLGMLLIWLGNDTSMAIAGSALAGAGLALLYPALGVEIIARTSPSNRSAALSTFAMFFDLSLGIAGPLMGALAALIGLRHIFLCATLFGLIGLLLAVLLLRRNGHSPTPLPS